MDRAMADDFEDDYFTALADAVESIDRDGTMPSVIVFRGDPVHLIDGDLLDAVIAQAKAMSTDSRGLDWRPTVFPDIEMNVGTIDDHQLDSHEGYEILANFADGNATTGDMAMLCSHAMTGIAGCTWETAEERDELATLKGLYAASQIAFREIFGPRLIGETNPPEIGDVVVDLFNPSMLGPVKAVWNSEDEVDPQIWIVLDDGMEASLNLNQTSIILESKLFPRIVPIADELSPQHSFVGRSLH